jgi:hypothetical protein
MASGAAAAVGGVPMSLANGISVTSLSDNPQYPCVLLQMPRLSILLDCALDSTTALNFLPLNLIPKAKLVGSVSLPPRARVRPMEESVCLCLCLCRCVCVCVCVCACACVCVCVCACVPACA